VVDLYVDERLVVLGSAKGAERFEGADAVSALSQALGALQRRRRWFERRSVRLWLSGSLARPFVVEAVTGLRSVSEAQAVAAAAAPGATGLAGPVVVVLESLPIERAALATAVEQRVLDGIHSSLRQHGVRVSSIRPWWARALEGCLRREPDTKLLCVEEPGVATLLAGDGPSLAMTIAPCDPAQLSALVRRVCIGQGLDVAQAALVRLDLEAWWNGELPARADPMVGAVV
jgi:hypothetical protein